MNVQLCFLTILFFASCSPSSSEKKELNNDVAKIDTTIAHFKTDSSSFIPEDSIANNNYAIFFTVVADTGFDYYSVRKKMFAISNLLNIPIDTMGRYYNKKRNLISLPENDKDELYAGNYFPRRFPSESLSLEYLRYYQSNSNEKTIALIAGLFDKEKSADSILSVLKHSEINAFKVKSKMYVGCVH